MAGAAGRGPSGCQLTATEGHQGGIDWSEFAAGPVRVGRHSAGSKRAIRFLITTPFNITPGGVTPDVLSSTGRAL